MCIKCNDTGVEETGNNDLPCDCPAGDTALFNVTGAGGKNPVSGALVRRHFLNDSPEPFATVDTLRAEVAQLRSDLADARAWLDAGPDDPASVEGVVERLLACGTGPTPGGYTESCCIVGRLDVREIVRTVAAQAKVIAAADAYADEHYSFGSSDDEHSAYRAARAALGKDGAP